MPPLIAEAVQPLNKAQCEDVRRALPTRMDTDRYQLEALVRTHFRGQLITDQQRRCCFYSVWRPDMLPHAIGLHNVAGEPRSSRSRHRIHDAYGRSQPGE